MDSQVMGTADEVVQDLVRELDQPAFLAVPSKEVLQSLIEAQSEAANPSAIRILASRTPLKQIRQNFPVTSKAADLSEEGLLEFRSIREDSNSQLLISEDSVTAILTAGDTATGLTTEDDNFVVAANDQYSSLWNDADEFPLRTPPLTQVRETLREEFGDGFVDDFQAELPSLESTGEEPRLDIVDLLLLLSAKHQELLYNISKWAEDIELSSKATFSRNKTALEEQGLIGAEKVPIDVGRPRLRLKLASENLEKLPRGELIL